MDGGISMKAAVMTEPYKIGIVDRPVPEPGEREVRVRMISAGICGGDVHFYTGNHPYANYPQIFGHELSGVVDSIGSQVTKVKRGDRIVVEPGIPCGTCYPCRIGKYNCCVNIAMIGAFRPGGFADYVTADEDYVHRMPDDMPHEVGALCEPFTIGAQVVDRAGVKPGNTVTILGMGPIGLTILILLKNLHQVKVIAVDVVAERLKQAAHFGADMLINPREQDPVKAVDDLTGGEGSNIVIESAGLKKTMEQTIHMVSPGGRIVIVGLTRDDVTFPGILFTKKEVEIYGSRNNKGKFPEVIRFLHDHPAIAKDFISHRMPFERIAEALEFTTRHPDEVVKMILDFK
jgi:L-gulonate 5-dehydrogenase